jgi:hypothetical protein
MSGTDPQWLSAIFAGGGLLILWTSTVIGAAIWLMRQFKALKEEILEDFEKKHQANEINVKALEALVIRHDLILEPEFNGSGRSGYTARNKRQ